MIHSITAQNFQSIADTATLNFTINQKASEKNGGYMTSDSGTRLSLVGAIVGGNASGKTTMLKALTLISWLHNESFRRNPERSLPVKGFAGSESNLKSPTHLSVTFEMNGIIFEYSVGLTARRVISEELSLRSLTSTRVTVKKVFARTWDEESKEYSINDNYFKLKEPYWTASELGNTSIIAAAARFGNVQARELVKYWRGIKANIDVDDRFLPYQYQAYHALNHYEEDETLRESAEKDVRRYDLGIQKFGKNGTILHNHGTATFELEIDEESSGTQQFIALKDMIDKVLVNGGMAVVDELNAYLHPMMSEAIIQKFLDPGINTGRGQLLFSTHDLRAFEILDRYQIFLAEKDKMGITSIQRFDSNPQVRPTDNYIKKYLSGIYGAINKLRP